MAPLVPQHVVQQRPLSIKGLQQGLEKQAFVSARGRSSYTNHILDFSCRENLPLGITFPAEVRTAVCHRLY